MYGWLASRVTISIGTVLVTVPTYNTGREWDRMYVPLFDGLRRDSAPHITQGERVGEDVRTPV